jgi:hypothetical protein
VLLWNGMDGQSSSVMYRMPSAVWRWPFKLLLDLAAKTVDVLYPNLNHRGRPVMVAF